MPGKKMTVTKSTTTTKKATPVNSTTRAKYTDTQKKAAAIKGGPGVKIAPKGTTMGTAQRNAGKEKAEEFKGRHGSYPTPAFMKKNPKAR